MPSGLLPAGRASRIVALAVVLLPHFGAFGPSRGGQAAIPIETKVCSILAAPRAYQGRLVRFRARFETDGYHFSYLGDFPCSRGVIAPYDHSTFSGPAKQAYNRAVYCPQHGFSATFTGWIRWRNPALQGPERLQLLFPPPPVSIDVTDVADIRFTQCP